MIYFQKKLNEEKNNLDELIIEDGRIVNIEELLQESDKEYEPKEEDNRSDSDDEDEIEKDRSKCNKCESSFRFQVV